MSQKITLSGADFGFGFILAAAVRYALGRSTAAPSIVIEFLTPLIPSLSTKILRVIKIDLDFEDYASNAADWLELRQQISDELHKRKER